MAETRRVLNRYRLVERIALGGTAEVWRAHDEQLDRPVAVKRLHAHLLPDEPSRRRLAGEARAAASLTHPAIVEIYDIDVTGEAAALVMELVEGESLAARIDREGALPERDAALIAADVADALFHAHQHGDRDAALHGARAAVRWQDRTAHRPLRARGRAPRGAYRPAAVPIGL